MGVTVKSTNNIPDLVKTLKKLDKKEIRVGIFGSHGYKYGDNADIATVAFVQEYGATIKPKTAQWLTIPLVPEAKNRNARDFRDLIFREVEPHKLAFLSREKGKDDFEDIFVLVKSVTIPERSFLRTGFDKNVDKIATKIESMLNDVLNFGINPDIFLDAIGLEFASKIQLYMKNLHEPPNASITASVKGSSNPLHDTGRLIGSIRHEVN